MAETLRLEKYQDVPFYAEYFSQNVQAILFDQLLGPIGWRPQRFYPGPQSSHVITQDLPTYQPSHEDSNEDSNEDSSEEEVLSDFGVGDWKPIIIN